MFAHYLQKIDPDVIAELLSSWKREHPQMAILAFLPEDEKHHVLGLQSACRKLEVPLLGAIFPALITEIGFDKRGVIFLRFDQRPAVFLLESFDGNEKNTDFQITQATLSALGDSVGTNVPSLFLLFDGMIPNVGTMLVTFYRKLKQRVRYVGGNAGSETFQPMPCLFDAHQHIGNGALAILLPTEHRFTVQHHYPVSESLFSATSTDGNRIDQIDGRPAMKVYQEVVEREFAVTLTPETFYDYAVHYPFGLVSAVEVLVRIPVAFNDDGSIWCVGEIPANSRLRLLHAPPAADETCIANVAKVLQPTADSQLLVLYCAGRRMHHGPAANYELDSLKRTTKALDLLGALSLGEIGSDEVGIPIFHNAAIVGLR